MTLSQVSRDLGISTSALHRWKKTAADKGTQAFPGHGKQLLTPLEQELQKFRKENEILRQEREILKKAAAFLPRTGSKAVWSLGRFFAKESR